MIELSPHNTQWWGKPVGLLRDRAFFSLTPEEQAAHLAPFDWVEFKAGLSSQLALIALQRAGFMQIDTQIGFRLALRQVQSSPSLEAFDLHFADQTPFSLGQEDLAPFVHERFAALPGMTDRRLMERYAGWANQIIDRSPEWSLRLMLDGQCQGWFLAEKSKKGLNLTLAMAHARATSSGLYLYQKALLAFARRGARLGWASFSISNTPVLNIYSRLGARFTGSTGYWLWLNT